MKSQLEYKSGPDVQVMAEPQKVTVLLADEDSLRRDGLSSVLTSTAGIDVIAKCGDGMTALEEIRTRRPDVAVVDLNLPGLHGIELVRRVRAENLETKIIILSGSMDDDIVREVVRAGADAYLLKNGPARHLTDAISYVRDGGQYFSPQLRRDGRDRHLLEEPPRVPPQPAGPARVAEDAGGNRDGFYRSTEGSSRRERRSRPRQTDRAHLQQRIRREASHELEDRDYEIMAEMADGIRPILDRLDEIEERVMEMEAGDQPVPSDPRGWLSAQLTDTLAGAPAVGSRVAGERVVSRVSSREMELRLPQLIEEAVNRRFQSMAGKLQAEIEEQHVRTLETFVKNIQVKLVQRVSALEQNMQEQSDAMLQLHEYNQRTEDNLSRLISGVDKLAQELPKRLAAQTPATEVITEAPFHPGRRDSSADGGTASEILRPESLRPETFREVHREKTATRSGGGPRIATKKLLPMLFWAVVGIGLVAAGIYEVRSSSDGTTSTTTVPPLGKEMEAAKANAKAASQQSSASVTVPGSDTKTKLEAAKQYMDRKEYTTAEDIYKQVVEEQPNNAEALRGLASVLYREDKIEESTAVLDRLPKN